MPLRQSCLNFIVRVYLVAYEFSYLSDAKKKRAVLPHYLCYTHVALI